MAQFFPTFSAGRLICRYVGLPLFIDWYLSVGELPDLISTIKRIRLCKMRGLFACSVASWRSKHHQPSPGLTPLHFPTAGNRITTDLHLTLLGLPG
jgi:hypothetical protein